MNCKLSIFSLATLLFLFIAANSIATDNLGFDQTSVVTSAAVSVSNITEVNANLEFNLEHLESEEIWVGNQLYDRFIIEGETAAGSMGEPGLPSVTRMVLIPPRCGVEVQIINRSTRILNDVNPAKNDLINHEGFYPQDVVEFGSPAILRGYRILPVKINPVRWNPQTRELEITESLDFELDFTSDDHKVNLVKNPERPRPSRYAYNLVSNLVINPPPPMRDLDRQSGSILYVTASGNQWDNVVEELEPLIEWRRRMGWSVDLLRVQNNQNNNAIRNEIIERYEGENPPEYVIICGDADQTYTMACWIHYPQGNPYETDHNYSMLEGNDVLPEVGLGRLVFRDLGMLRNQVNKIIQYESEPYIGQGDEVGWQKRAACASTDWRNGSSANNLCRWSRALFLDNGFTNVNEFYCSSQNAQPDPSQFITSNFAEGISVFVYRGWVNMNGFRHDNVMQLRNRQMLPLVILSTCNTGDFLEHAYNDWSYAERFMYYSGGGGIGGIGTGGATHTVYNNLITAGILRGMFAENIHTQGWALMRGKLDLYRAYYERGDINHHRTGQENWLTHTFIFNLMGDPAVDNFTDAPQILSVGHPEELRTGESQVIVEVEFEREEENEPAANVLVCLYKPEEFQIKAWTNEEGIAEFHLDPEWTQDGSIQLTITGHNLMTYLADLEITDADRFIGAFAFEIDDDEEGDSQGDGDGIVNPTERIELTVDIQNYGEEIPEGVMSVVLTPALPNLEVIDGEVEFEAAPNAGESVAAQFVVEIGGGFPHGESAAFNLQTTIGEETWHSSIGIPVEGPQIEFVSFDWEGNPLTPANVGSMTITVRNAGAKASPQITGTLNSETITIDVPEPECEFAPIEPDEEGTSDGTFTLSASPIHLGGNMAELILVLASENGFRDEITFSFIVGEGQENQPFGPDGYG